MNGDVVAAAALAAEERFRGFGSGVEEGGFEGGEWFADAFPPDGGEGVGGFFEGGPEVHNHSGQ